MLASGVSQRVTSHSNTTFNKYQSSLHFTKNANRSTKNSDQFINHSAMAIDAYSFAAPSRVKVLVVPVGRIKRSRFLECVERLRSVNDIKLGDVSPDSRGSRSTAIFAM